MAQLSRGRAGSMKGARIVEFIVLSRANPRALQSLVAWVERVRSGVRGGSR